MKTYKGWEKSDVNLDKYLTEPCEIDEELCLYLAEVTPPNYSGDDGITQTGEASFEKDGKLHYMTVQFCGNDKYKYLGELPDMDVEDEEENEQLEYCGHPYFEFDSCPLGISCDMCDYSN